MVWSPISDVAANVGFSWENIILLIVIMGSLVFYAKDFKLGIVIDILLTAGLFVGFYAGGFNYVPSLVLFFMFIVVLTLTLYTTNRFAQAGGLI